jgi:hypothetical protein
MMITTLRQPTWWNFQFFRHILWQTKKIIDFALFWHF